MPTRIRPFHAATAIAVVGLALAVTSAFLLKTHRGLGFGLMAASIALMFVGSWVSTLGRSQPSNSSSSRGS